jgi:hypothetical protein
VASRFSAVIRLRLASGGARATARKAARTAAEDRDSKGTADAAPSVICLRMKVGISMSGTSVSGVADGRRRAAGRRRDRSPAGREWNHRRGLLGRDRGQGVVEL